MVFNVKTPKRKETESSLFKMPKEDKFKENQQDSFEEDKLSKESRKLDEKMNNEF